jgi:hypothetical protein
MKKFNWILFLVLNYVTCGLWGIYVWTVITKNKNVMAEKYGVQKIMGYIPAFLLTMITCGIYGLVWFYKMSKQQVELNKALGAELDPSDNPIVFFIIMFVPFYGFYVLFKNYNAAVDAYERA